MNLRFLILSLVTFSTGISVLGFESSVRVQSPGLSATTAQILNSRPPPSPPLPPAPPFQRRADRPNLPKLILIKQLLELKCLQESYQRNRWQNGPGFVRAETVVPNTATTRQLLRSPGGNYHLTTTRGNTEDMTRRKYFPENRRIIFVPPLTRHPAQNRGNLTQDKANHSNLSKVLDDEKAIAAKSKKAETVNVTPQTFPPEDEVMRELVNPIEDYNIPMVSFGDDKTIQKFPSQPKTKEKSGPEDDWKRLTKLPPIQPYEVEEIIEENLQVEFDEEKEKLDDGKLLGVTTPGERQTDKLSTSLNGSINTILKGLMSPVVVSTTKAYKPTVGNTTPKATPAKPRKLGDGWPSRPSSTSGEESLTTSGIASRFGSISGKKGRKENVDQSSPDPLGSVESVTQSESFESLTESSLKAIAKGKEFSSSPSSILRKIKNWRLKMLGEEEKAKKSSKGTSKSRTGVKWRNEPSRFRPFTSPKPYSELEINDLFGFSHKKMTEMRTKESQAVATSTPSQPKHIGGLSEEEEEDRLTEDAEDLPTVSWNLHFNPTTTSPESRKESQTEEDTISRIVSKFLKPKSEIPLQGYEDEFGMETVERDEGSQSLNPSQETSETKLVPLPPAGQIMTDKKLNSSDRLRQKSEEEISTTINRLGEAEENIEDPKAEESRKEDASSTGAIHSGESKDPIASIEGEETSTPSSGLGTLLKPHPTTLQAQATTSKDISHEATTSPAALEPDDYFVDTEAPDLDLNPDFKEFIDDPLYFDLLPATTPKPGGSKDLNWKNSRKMNLDEFTTFNEVTEGSVQRRSDILISDDYYGDVRNQITGHSYMELLNQRKNSSAIVPMIPTIINDLREGKLSSEDTSTLSHAFGKHWPSIVALSRNANLDMLPLLKMKDENDLLNVLNNFVVEQSTEKAEEPKDRNQNDYPGYSDLYEDVLIAEYGDEMKKKKFRSRRDEDDMLNRLEALREYFGSIEQEQNSGSDYMYEDTDYDAPESKDSAELTRGTNAHINTKNVKSRARQK